MSVEVTTLGASADELERARATSIEITATTNPASARRSLIEVRMLACGPDALASAPVP
jgi:hypothetical protein